MKRRGEKWRGEGDTGMYGRYGRYGRYERGGRMWDISVK